MRYRFNKSFMFSLILLMLLLNIVEYFLALESPLEVSSIWSTNEMSKIEDNYNRKFKNPDTILNEPIYRVDMADKKIAFTFDINWAEKECLPDILNILDKHSIKCTFFMMGKWITYPEENGEKLKEINKRGHEIGNHSFVHPDFKAIGKERMISEVKKTEDIINKSIGVTTKLFRFPSGSYTREGVEIIRSLGYEAIQWDVDSVDWKQLGLDREYNRVIKNVKPGSIVLFHNDGIFTPENLERLIPELKSQGYSFVTVGELIYKENFEIDEQGTQKAK